MTSTSAGSLERTLDRTIELLSATPQSREARALLIEARRLRSVVANWRSIPPPADVRDEMVDRVIQLSAAVGGPVPEASAPEVDDGPQISLEAGGATDDVYSLDFEPHLYSLDPITTQRRAIPPPPSAPRDLGPPLDGIDFEPEATRLGPGRRPAAPNGRAGSVMPPAAPAAKKSVPPPANERPSASPPARESSSPQARAHKSVPPPARESSSLEARAQKSVPPPARESSAPQARESSSLEARAQKSVPPPARESSSPAASKSVAPPPLEPVTAKRSAPPPAMPQPITRPSVAASPRPDSEPPPAPVEEAQPELAAARSTPPPAPEPERTSQIEPIPRADLGLEPREIDELGVPRTLVTAQAVTLADPPHPTLVFLTSPYSQRADAYRSLRRKLASSGNPRVIAVSSAHPGEGKTTMAVNLALTLRESARGRVLLLEANHRAPALAKLLGFMPSRCVLDQLADHVDDPRAPWIAAEPLPKLHVLAIDPKIKREPILDPVAFGSGMDRLKQAGYDYIIVDAPPVLGSVDGNVISDSVEGMIFTALTMKSKRREMRKAVEQIEPAPVLGVVVLEA